MDLTPRHITWSLAVSNDMTATIDSDVIPILRQESQGAFIQLAWTSTPVGTLKLQVSNDGSIWSDLTGITVDTGGAAGSTSWSIADAFFQYMRVGYARTSGDGTLTGTVNIK